MSVTEIHRYPVKSMLGESLPHCRVDQHGLVGDRGYALIEVETGAVASAKVPRRWAGLLDFTARYLAEPRPGDPLPPVEITFPDSSVHRSDAADIDGTLSGALGRQVRLSTTAPEGATFEELWPQIDGLAPQKFVDATTSRRDEHTGEAISRLELAAFAPGSFFDLSAVHVLAESTLQRLRELAPDATFDARRYRPNLLLDDTADGFVENSWPGRTLAVGEGGARLTVSMPTMRCVMTTLAQSELPVDAGTLRTIAKHNRVEIPEMGTWACAGAYADVAAGGEVRVGDAVRVT
jgi:uncharacterized protein YcbX